MPAHERLTTTEVREALLHAIALLELRRDALLGYADEIADMPSRAVMVEGAGRAESSAAVLRGLIELAGQRT
jgi:hypothetical protein